MHDKVQGQGVAEAIGAVKYALIGSVVVVGVTASVDVATTTLPRWVMVAFLLATGLWSLVIWVLFGWAEYTLQNLIQIERNTRPRSVEDVTGLSWPADEQIPPSWSPTLDPPVSSGAHSATPPPWEEP